MRDESVKGAVLFSISNETTPEKYYHSFLSFN